VIVPGARMFLMEFPVRSSVGAMPFLVFFRICEPFLVRIAMLRIELLVEALVLRMVSEMTKVVLIVV
jgi:hypothetical protein